MPLSVITSIFFLNDGILMRFQRTWDFFVDLGSATRDNPTNMKDVNR